MSPICASSRSLKTLGQTGSPPAGTSQRIGEYMSPTAEKPAGASVQWPPLVPGPVEGFEATVVGIKANEAVLSGSKVTFQPDWFTL